MSGPNFRTIAVAILTASFTASCSLTPDYFRPELPVPPAYTARSATSEPAIDPQWWRLFRNRTLTRLITEANVDNTDIAAAITRVRQARANFRIARSALFPQIDSSGNVALTHTEVKGLPDTTRKTWRLDSALDWDLDIFGGNRAATAAARADVAASQFDREAVELATQAEVASTYIAMLLARERLRISADTIGNFIDVLKIAEARFKAGAGSALDVSQQKSALATVRAARALLEEDVQNAENAIAVLIGDPAGTLKLAGGGLSAMRAPTIRPGQPIALLARRPDIRRAEADLIAANADIGVARAALFPNLSLNVDAAISSDPLTKTISIGSTLLAPIFHGGRLRAGVKLSEARKAELVEAYRKTYLVALREVEDALAAVRSAQKRVAQLSTAIEEARNAYRLQRIQYEAGAIDFQTLLDAQRTLFDADENLAVARFDRLNAAVDLIRALGGGWVEEQAMLLRLIALG
jgi:NodT family efflux transporter outer membrane factor (OMF) lipoprotein